MNENFNDTTMETIEKRAQKRLNLALIRAVAALIIAGVILASTGFAVIDLLEGPKESTVIQDEEQGAFVSSEIFNILGFYADDVKDEKVVGRYALTKMGTKLVSVYFTQRYLESADTVCDDTYDFLSRKIQAFDHYVKVQGTVDVLSEKSSGLMYDWFGLNKAQLVEMGVIADTEDYADHLADQVLIVDTVNGYDQAVVIVLSSVAAALLLYMIVELALMGVGFYAVKPKKEEKAETEDEE